MQARRISIGAEQHVLRLEGELARPHRDDLARLARWRRPRCWRPVRLRWRAAPPVPVRRAGRRSRSAARWRRNSRDPADRDRGKSTSMPSAFSSLAACSSSAASAALSASSSEPQRSSVTPPRSAKPSQYVVRLLRKRPQFAHLVVPVALHRAVIVDVQPGDHEPGVAAARAQRHVARLGDHDLAPRLSREIGGRAADHPRADDQKIDFAHRLVAVRLPQ